MWVNNTLTGPHRKHGFGAMFLKQIHVLRGPGALNLHPGDAEPPHLGGALHTLKISALPNYLKAII